MFIIFNKASINFTNKEDVTLVLPSKININDLFYKIEHESFPEKITLFMDILDGKEKLIQLTLNGSGIKEDNLNSPGLFQSESFEVEKIKLICFRDIKLLFTLWKED
ncbi:MAG: hypothetical protein H0W61_03455 [Bacteroidetes bacterium]|nr:hypothetical protein [Bacteroidota bacterium]